MRLKSNASLQKSETVGYLFGALGVTIFSLTFPMTKLAIPVFGSSLTTSARAVIAGILAAAVLAWVRPQVPGRNQWRSILVVSLCFSFMFPLLFALALEELPASRAGVVIGILPTTTALVGSLRQHQRPGWQFWLAAAVGLAAVTSFSLAGGPSPLPKAADILLLAAIVVAALGYTEGAQLSNEIGGWQTICWSVVVALPVTIPVTIWLASSQPIQTITPEAIVGLTYVGVGSSLVGFFAWYAGLSRGGIARVSQVQLIQPLLTLAASAVLLGETITVGAVVTGVVVIGCVVVSRRAPIRSTNRAPSILSPTGAGSQVS